MKKDQIWLVTGASKGLGLALVKKLLASGFKVAATSRNLQALTRETGGPSASFLPLQVDLVNESSVQAAINRSIQHFGKIDIVVNNAGYGQTGALEELTDQETRTNFDVNVFGLLHVIRNVMPHFRSQQSGHVINIASVGGYAGGFAGWGIYCSTKFAVAGLTEALAEEANPLGIHATVVYPGYFRTNFLAEDSLIVPANPIQDYAAARASREQHQSTINGNQPGDPEKAAEVLINIAAAKQPPVHLFLGKDAYNMVGIKNKVVREDMETWKAQATATDFVV